MEEKVERNLNDEAIWVRIKTKEIKKQMEYNKLGMIGINNIRSRKSKLTQSEQENEINKKIEYLKKVITEEEQYEVQIWASEEMVKLGEKGVTELKEIATQNKKGSRAAGKTLVRAGIK